MSSPKASVKELALIGFILLAFLFGMQIVSFMFGWGFHASIDYNKLHGFTNMNYFKHLWYKIRVRLKKNKRHS